MSGPFRRENVNAFSRLIKHVMNFNKLDGITLTELIVASAVIGIIMVGVVSVDYAIKKSKQSISAQTILTMQTGGVMLDISKNIALATGDRNDIGVVDNPNVCARQDQNALQTPDDYTDDTWVCYDLSGTTLSKCNLGLPGGCPIGTSEVVGNNVTSIIVTPQFIAGLRFSVDIQVTCVYDPAEPINPITNPEYILTSCVSPPGHSF